MFPNQYNGAEPSSQYLEKMAKPRTFKEQLEDQRAYHQSKLDDINKLLKLLTPEQEAFMEALYKVQRG